MNLYARSNSYFDELHCSQQASNQMGQSFGYNFGNLPMAYSNAFPLPHGQLRASNIKVELENSDLWEKFHQIGTEMIITKTGRWVDRQTLIPDGFNALSVMLLEANLLFEFISKNYLVQFIAITRHVLSLFEAHFFQDCNEMKANKT